MNKINKLGNLILVQDLEKEKTPMFSYHIFIRLIMINAIKKHVNKNKGSAWITLN